MPKLLEELKAKRSEIMEIADKYGVSNIRVFGSVAEGKEKKTSDIDLLVNIDYKKYGSGFARVDFKQSVEEFLHHEVDVITEKSLHPLLKKGIMKEAVPL